MRIVSGHLKGRRLPAAVSPHTRPTTDRVREAIFSSLQGICELPESRVLDLYAGTGALGIEALSRGAKSATFIEQDRAQAAAVRKTIDTFGLTQTAEVRCGSVERLLEELDGPYDLLFADPPYGAISAEDLITRLLGISNLVQPGSLLVWEGDRPLQPPPEESVAPESGLCARLHRDRRYGNTVVSYIMFFSC